MYLAKSARLPPRASMPWLNNCCLTSGVVMDWLMACDNLSCTSRGVDCGANTPNQTEVSYPLKPDSLTVGNLGAIAERCALVTAKALRAPLWMWGKAVDAGANITGTRPESTSVMACELPL